MRYFWVIIFLSLRKFEICMLKLRDRESNALVVAKEIDVLKDRIAELENIRNTLQLDLDNAVNFHCFFLYVSDTENFQLYITFNL